MKCICCDNKVLCDTQFESDGFTQEDAVFRTEKRTSRDKSITIQAESRMWNDGMVGNISAGYGSRFDGDCYAIAICDECISKKLESGIIACTGNYMMNLPEEKEKYLKIWRRNNNLDELI